jgi:hypothetical protein
MSNTRKFYDSCRTNKELQQSTDPGRYMLNVPGNGDKPAYMADPQIILQKWGGNLWSDSVNLESKLLGYTEAINTKDCLGKNKNTLPGQPILNSHPISYPVSVHLTTDQSRASHPAWLYRDLEQVDWHYLPLNPQENTCMPFQNNLSSRIIQKDYFIRNLNGLEHK